MSRSDRSQLTVPRPATGSVDRRRPWTAWALAAVEILVAGNAVLGGVELIRTGYGIPRDWLQGTPFPDWTWPGVLLIATVALPQLAAAGAALIRTGWWPRIGWLAGLLAGLGLIAWILVQLAVIGHYFFLQPVIAGLGLVEVGLAEYWRRRAR